MKSISAGLDSHLAGEATSICTIVKVTRNDGTIFGFTDLDIDLVISSVTYKSAFGYIATNIETQVGFNVDTLDISGFMDPQSFTEAEISAGKWDYADVRVSLVNWSDLSQGTLKLRRGWLGEVRVTRSFVAELRGVAQRLQQPIVELVTNSCVANLFDARCKVVDTEGLWKFTGVAVSTVISSQRQFTASALTQSAGYFTSGKVSWTTGANANFSKEIKTHATGGDILLQEAMPYAIAVADTFTIWAGCQKRFTEDCGTKFSNQVNFRGFPYVPGEDSLFKGP